MGSEMCIRDSLSTYTTAFETVDLGHVTLGKHDCEVWKDSDETIEGLKLTLKTRQEERKREAAEEQAPTPWYDVANLLGTSEKQDEPYVLPSLVDGVSAVTLWNRKSTPIPSRDVTNASQHSNASRATGAETASQVSA